MAGTTFYMTVSLYLKQHDKYIDSFYRSQQLFDGPTNGKSSYFLLPYAAWLTYATYLNGGIWYLNQGRRIE